MLAFLWYKNCIEHFIAYHIHLTTVYTDVIVIITWLQIIKMVNVINVQEKKYFTCETMKK
jgi:hypothetical protein